MSLKELSNKEFIDRLKADLKNELLWIHFVKRYRDIMGYVVWQQFTRQGYKSFSQVEDVVQIVLLILSTKDCQYMRDFRNQYDGSIISLLKMISAREAIRWMKKMDGFETGPLETEPQEPEESPGADPMEIRHQINLCLDKIMEKNPHRDRNKLIYKMYFFDEVPMKHIAKKLNIKLSYQSVARIIQALNKLIQEYCTDGSTINIAAS